MRALVLLMLAPAALLAQAGTWNLLHGINPGKSVHVHMLDGHRNSGSFISTTESSIIIRQRTGDQTFPKDLIRKISVRKFGRLRNIAIGAGIGAAAGSGVGAFTIRDGDYSGFIVGTVFFGLVGAGIGAVVPSYVTIYRLPRK